MSDEQSASGNPAITADDIRAFAEGLREALPLDDEQIRQVRDTIAQISPEEMTEIRTALEDLASLMRRGRP
jgi:hypothetical protein